MTVPSDRESAIGVHRAVQADLLAVFRIEKRSFPQPWPFSAFERFLGAPGFLVARENGIGGEGNDVIGYIVADTVPNHGRAIGHVKDIAVHPEYRGQGIGRELLEGGLAVLAEEGTSRVKLEVREGNEPALGLYRQFGFELKRRIPRYYANGDTAFVMVRSMEP